MHIHEYIDVKYLGRRIGARTIKDHSVDYFLYTIERDSRKSQAFITLASYIIVSIDTAILDLRDRHRVDISEIATYYKHPLFEGSVGRFNIDYLEDDEVGKIFKVLLDLQILFMTYITRIQVYRNTLALEAYSRKARPPRDDPSV
jgi:hypothetical protein